MSTPTALRVQIGQCSQAGRKPINQDAVAARVPQISVLHSKGLVAALADGISSSRVSQEASQTAVQRFIDDYLCTSDAWSVKTAAEHVLRACNAQLYAHNQQGDYRYDKNLGYVCTFSALIIKSTTAHLVHVGDTRIYRIAAQANMSDPIRPLEQLTNDHRVRVSAEQSYLSRALGFDSHLEIDYLALPVQQGDCFLLASDGVYDYINADIVAQLMAQHGTDADAIATGLVDHAYAQGSTDNLTALWLVVDQLPDPDAHGLYQQLNTLPFAPILEARQMFEGYQIIRTLHDSSRSHVYLAADVQQQHTVVIKTPSTELREQPAYLERFLLEEWIARRIDSPHVLKAYQPDRPRQSLYLTMEYIQGQTLNQWMIDHPKPDLESVRGIVEQIAKGLRAFHRLEMLHQDLRPANIMIDHTGTVKIIDFGAVEVAGILDIRPNLEQTHLMGTAQYAAPEYFIGERGSVQSDQFSLAVIAYQMLSGQLPYGTDVAKCNTKLAQRHLRYRSVLADDRAIPAWIDDTLKKALNPDPDKRYDDLSEFIYDLRHPNPAFGHQTRKPLIDQHPVAFWQAVSCVLLLVIVLLLAF